MKKILVTGASGFIGNHVVEILLRNGCNVIATTSNPEKAKETPWFSKVKYIPLDFHEFDRSTNLYTYFNEPDAIIHLAWERLPNYKALFHFETNLPKHYEFLKNLIVNGLKDITVTGTCLEYGMQQGKLDEEMLALPSNPYALAKHTLYNFLSELEKFHSFSLKWVRLFYLYGKGQNPNSLFSQLENALTKNETVFNMSGGEQVRDYLPVEIMAEYIVKICLQKDVTGIINCCSGNPITVKELVQQFLMEKNKEIALNLGYYPYSDYEPMAFWGNNAKLKTILNED